MADQGRRDKTAKTAVLSQWGNSLMNKLPAIARRRLKRAADKMRRRAARKEIAESLD